MWYPNTNYRGSYRDDNYCYIEPPIYVCGLAGGLDMGTEIGVTIQSFIAVRNESDVRLPNK